MISVQDVSKYYGRTAAVDHLSLELGENKIYSLLGCNGAGKTTLMKLIAGHISLDGGCIEVDGRAVTTKSMPDCVSFIENRAAQFNSGLDKLIQMAGILDDKFDNEFAQRMMKKFHLDKGKKFGRLSFGMQTMFNTLLSLASNRKVILLDEPLLGLDAVMRNKFYNLLNDSFENHPRTIFISTHLIDEMTKSAEELIIMDKGKIIFRSSVNDIDEKAYSITGISKIMEPVLNNLNVIGRKEIGGYTTAYIFDERSGIPDGYSVHPVGLQDFFINMVGGDYDEE